ncbi:Beta-glucuronidase [Halotydeus destructor]|nr:Beta-glucuronidase [Halotydeus destructor]
MIHRDKNRPSVVMWSIANEPMSEDEAAKNYFKRVVQHARSLDTSRPISAAMHTNTDNAGTDKMAPFLDLLMLNRYFGWYTDSGALQVISRQVVTEFDTWHKQHGKLMLISEYGADTVSGMHSSPSAMFTEDFQADYLLNHFNAFDTLKNRANAYFVGEHIWNFADFMTDESVLRVHGNREGIFTRERQPKASARFLRCRYLSLANVTTEDLEDQLMYCPARRL